MKLRPYLTALALCTILAPRLAAGQQIEEPARTLPLPSVFGLYDDRLRVDQLLGRASTNGYLLRSTTTLLPPLPEDSTPRFHLQFLLPHLKSIWNSEMPYSLNDGALWAGRGVNLHLTGGVRAAYGPITLVFAPELRYEQNQPFPFVPYPLADRSQYSARWHWAALPISVDMPTRFGDEPRAAFGPGQTSVTAAAGPVRFGWARDDQWWGPGVRNAIVMSNNAPGIPRIFIRTGPPISTPIGDLELLWSAGVVQESAQFDTISNNGQRYVSGFAMTYRPAGEPGLTLGASRSVIGRMRSFHDFPQGMISPFVPKQGKSEQVASVFGRWIFPSAGFEAYAEWARYRLTSSLRDFLISPNHTQGYTVGVQWARPVNADTSGILRLHTEITYLEQSTTTRHRPTGSFYTSNDLPQGYTQRGQIIGAATGPGSSSQWIAGDYLADSWQLGLFAGRIRWDNDAYYLTQEPFPLDHDVSIFGGLRGVARLGPAWLELEYTRTHRYNFMFQNQSTALGEPGTGDVDNNTLRLTVRPGPLGSLLPSRSSGDRNSPGRLARGR